MLQKSFRPIAIASSDTTPAAENLANVAPARWLRSRPVPPQARFGINNRFASGNSLCRTGRPFLDRSPSLQNAAVAPPSTVLPDRLRRHPDDPSADENSRRGNRASDGRPPRRGWNAMIGSCDCWGRMTEELKDMYWAGEIFRDSLTMSAHGGKAAIPPQDRLAIAERLRLLISSISAVSIFF
jgi:hypothetical protein